MGERQQTKESTFYREDGYLIKGLVAAGAEYVVHDPFIKEHSGDLYEKAQGCDAVVLMTAHSEYKDIDFKRLKEAMGHTLLVDGRNLWSKERAADAGMELIRLGA